MKEVFRVRWQPGRDTALAFGTLVLFIPIYWSGANLESKALRLLLFALVGNLFLNFAIPAWYMLRVRGEGLDSIGMDARHWGKALLLSVVVTAFSAFRVHEELQAHPGVEPVPQLLYNGLILWEPFFVYCWLQLRFERAFGILPGIVLAGVSFSLYHVGTASPEGVFILMGSGIFYAVLFRIVGGHLLAVWPLTWAAGSTIGTLRIGLTFEWSDIPYVAVLLVVQLALLAWLARGGSPRPASRAEAGERRR